MIAIVDPRQADAVMVGEGQPPLWQYLCPLVTYALNRAFNETGCAMCCRRCQSPGRGGEAGVSGVRPRERSTGRCLGPGRCRAERTARSPARQTSPRNRGGRSASAA